MKLQFEIITHLFEGQYNIFIVMQSSLTRA